VKTDAPWPGLVQARVRVLGMQAKLHRWSNGDATARFDDLFNLGEPIPQLRRFNHWFTLVTPSRLVRRTRTIW